jgi:hypothetical protein
MNNFKKSLKISIVAWLVAQCGISFVSIISQKSLTIPQFIFSRSTDLKDLTQNTKLKTEDFTGFKEVKGSLPIFNKQVNHNPLIWLFPISAVTRDSKASTQTIINLVSFGYNSPFPKDEQAGLDSLKVLYNRGNNITAPFGNNILKKSAFKLLENNPFGFQSGSSYIIDLRGERSPEYSKAGVLSLRQVDLVNTDLCKASLQNVKKLILQSAKQSNSSATFQENCTEREFTPEEYDQLVKIASNYNISQGDQEGIVFDLVNQVNARKINNQEVSEILDKHRLINTSIKLLQNNTTNFLEENQFSVNPILNPVLVWILIYGLLSFNSYLLLACMSRRPQDSYYRLAKTLISNDINITPGEFNSLHNAQIRLIIATAIQDTKDGSFDYNNLVNSIKKALKANLKNVFQKETLINPQTSWNIRYSTKKHLYKLFIHNQAHEFARIINYELANIDPRSDEGINLNMIVNSIINYSANQIANIIDR